MWESVVNQAKVLIKMGFKCASQMQWVQGFTQYVPPGCNVSRVSRNSAHWVQCRKGFKQYRASCRGVSSVVSWNQVNHLRLSETERDQVRPSDTMLDQVKPSDVRQSGTQGDHLRPSETKQDQEKLSEMRWGQEKPIETKWDQVRESDTKQNQVKRGQATTPTSIQGVPI